METVDRKKEIINSCLAILVEKGLTQTTTRDLSRAMSLQSGGMYYYFSTKDELIIACAEEAILRVEESLLVGAITEAASPKRMIEHLLANALEMAPTMKFFVSVCTDRRYHERMRPVLERVSARYALYAERFADALKTDAKEIAPFVYMLITAVSNYMVYGESSFISPQLQAVRIKFERAAAAGSGRAAAETEKKEREKTR